MVQPQSFRRHPLVWGIGVIGVIAVVAVLAAVLVFTAGGGGGRAEATSGAAWSPAGWWSFGPAAS
ncbi:hypothetical protein [Microbacterium sp. S16(2024)]|uniref:hypothetical protein n=1 Tax=Microbacterium sp. S16(2024) TaxID=3368601 RepID=UPI00373E9A80